MACSKSEHPRPSLLDRAAQAFDGWTDPDTGRRVLRIRARHQGDDGQPWSTLYHQYRCFLDGGRKVLLRRRGTPRGRSGRNLLLDLTTGEIEYPFPEGCSVVEVCDGTCMASLIAAEDNGCRVSLWDMRAGRETASLHSQGWALSTVNFLSDGQRALALLYRGTPYEEHVLSRHYLLAPGEPPRVVMEADGYFCNHIVGCPTDPNLYAYDRWPSPKRDVPQVIHIRTLDGRFDEAMRMAPDAMRPGDMWGARDHYVWTPDGKYIVSYLCPHPLESARGPNFNHFLFEWWLSVTDWRTGADICVKYPPGRWGGHMQVSPDSRYILCAGGNGFDRLFAVSIEELRSGWNEHIICSYPQTVSTGKNQSPFPFPFVLPDQSGVIFNAGWLGPEHGVYLAEWPAELQGARNA
jgi:hypothetical protein